MSGIDDERQRVAEVVAGRPPISSVVWWEIESASPETFQEWVARERLGLDVDDIPGGHLIALSQPVEVAGRLLAYLAELAK